MRQNHRNRCDEILALIDRCLAEYETPKETNDDNR
jgi:hypothetical protein